MDVRPAYRGIKDVYRLKMKNWPSCYGAYERERKEEIERGNTSFCLREQLDVEMSLTLNLKWPILEQLLLLLRNLQDSRYSYLSNIRLARLWTCCVEVSEEAVPLPRFHFLYDSL